MKKASFYVPALDGLRFFAFLLVFIHHGVRPTIFATGSVPRNVVGFLSSYGWMGVDLFLVLSAYLITTLLLLEHESCGRISLRDFYVRRVLRIWPLYYLMVVIGFFVLPLLGLFAPAWGTPSYTGIRDAYLGPYLFLFGNYAVAEHGYPGIRTLAHMWTVTLEEQFYIVWPALLIVLLRFRRLLTWAFLAAALVLTLVLRGYLASRTHHPMVWTNTLTRLDPLVLGAALAVFRMERRELGAAWWIKAAQFGLGCVLIVSISRAPAVETQSPNVIWQFFATAVGFVLIIDSAAVGAANPIQWLFSRPTLVWLGKLTYGLYVYHIIAIQFGGRYSLKLAARIGMSSPSDVWITQVLVSLGLTIGIAAVSYYYFERFFLRLKTRFAHVVSQAFGGDSSRRRSDRAEPDQSGAVPSSSEGSVAPMVPHGE